MKKIRTYLLPVLVVALAMGCQKVATNLTYHLTPCVQLNERDSVNQGDTLMVAVPGFGYPAEHAVGYLFAADTASWTVASYEHAREGILTSKSGGGEMPYGQRAEVDPAGQLVFGPLTGGPVMLVVALDDPDDDPAEPRMRLYAWRPVTPVENLPALHVRLWFRPWKTADAYNRAYYDYPDRYYRESDWMIFNGNPPSGETP